MAGDLSGAAKATSAGGGIPHGRFAVTVRSAPVQLKVNPRRQGRHDRVSDDSAQIAVALALATKRLTGRLRDADLSEASDEIIAVAAVDRWGGSAAMAR